jgi:hypothetical protein
MSKKLAQKTLVIAMMALCSSLAYAQTSNVTINQSITQTQTSSAKGNKGKQNEDTGKTDDSTATQVLDIGNAKTAGSHSEVTIHGKIEQTQEAGDNSVQVLEIGNAGNAEMNKDGTQVRKQTRGTSDVTIQGDITQKQTEAEESTQVLGIGNAKSGKSTVLIKGDVKQTQTGNYAVQVMNIGNAEVPTTKAK